MGTQDIVTAPMFEGQQESTYKGRIKSPAELRKAALKGTPSERAEFARQVSVSVDDYRIANRFVDDLIARSERSNRPGGLWIIGEGGVGKSFILESVYQRYQPTESHIARKCPILTLSLDGRPAESDIMLRFLLQMGQNPKLLRYSSNSELRDILIEALQACEVQAILFDEAHHLWLTTQLKRTPDRPGGRLGDFLKRLYDQSGVAYIFAGTGGLWDLYEKDKQARTRWPGRIRILDFNNDEKFCGLLATLDEALPMPRPAGLANEPIASRMYQATQGNFRLLKNLLADAVYLASVANEEKLSMKHLAGAYFGLFCDEATPFGPA